MFDAAVLTMIDIVVPRISRVVAALAVACLCWGTQAQAQSVAVMVNGEAITNFDIEQRTKLTVLSTQKSPSRQDVIDELINEKVKIKEGKKYSVDPSGAEVDGAFQGMSSRMGMTPDQLVQSLASKGIRANTLKSRLKADMVWNSLVRGRFKQSLQVGEKEVEAAVQAAGGDANAEAFEYQLRPLILIVPHGAGGGALEARKKQAEEVRERVQTCEEASSIFKSMQNSTIRAIVTKTSADIPPNLRELLDKTPVGHLTPPEVTKQGIEMVALCSRKPTKVDTPKKREIRDKMFAEKFEAKSKAYLQEVRNGAMIEYRQ
ncbi:SurA N-terminal domain-containing protein [soil metagenome]